MPSLRGRSIGLSLSRRMIGDFLRASRRSALVTVERHMKLATVRAARDAHASRPPWPVLFAKALAVTAEKCPALRQAYLPWPWARIYEHPVAVGSVVVAKELDGVEHLFVLPLQNPARATLEELTAIVHRAKERPPESTRAFRRTLRYSRLPFPFRKCIWSLLDWSGNLRAEYLGTFGISATASLGAAVLHLVTPWTVGLSYAPFREDGTIPVRVTLDHRVLDGTEICRILVETEKVLTGPILQELTGAGGTTSG